MAERRDSQYTKRDTNPLVKFKEAVALLSTKLDLFSRASNGAVRPNKGEPKIGPNHKSFTQRSGAGCDKRWAKFYKTG